MVRKNDLDARVVNGQLVLTESLQALEGETVKVTITSNGEPAGDDPPEDMDVEKDVWVPIPLKWVEVPNAVVVHDGPLRPAIILPERLEWAGVSLTLIGNSGD